jgi:hypothetical protein
LIFTVGGAYFAENESLSHASVKPPENGRSMANEAYSPRSDVSLRDGGVPRVSVIMPAYNEGRCIFENIRTTRAVLAEAGIEAEIVAVDDGSSDETRSEIARAAGAIPGVVAARNPYNMGKGMALRTGFDASSGGIVVFLDADLDLHPSQIRRLLDVLDEGPYDIVTTSKHHPDSKLDYPLGRKVASWVYYLFIKTLFSLPVRDTQTGLKVFRRNVLADVFHRLLVKKFAYDVELLAAAVRFGYRVREVPVVIDFRRRLKWGRIKFSDVLSLFVDTLAIFYRLRILRYYDAPRPPMPREHARVLVVAGGRTLSVETVARLEYDGVDAIACIAPRPEGDDDGVVRYFEDAAALGEWFDRERGGFAFVGFLGEGRLPLGSWVRNAQRNFGEPDVDAVCGPTIPGRFANRREEAAGMVHAAFLTAGFDTFLYAFRTVRAARKASAGNLFLRSSRIGEGFALPRWLHFRGGYVTLRNAPGTVMRYDPDVAVSKRIPPLFVPYLREAWNDSFSRGRGVFERGNSEWPYREGIQLLVVILVAAGYVFLPLSFYIGLLSVCGAAVAVSAGAYFSLWPAFPAAVGIIGECLVRAAAAVAGVAAGIGAKHSSDGDMNRWFSGRW